MAIVSRHYWKPTDIDKFVKCHREFHDNHLKNAGAIDMKLYKHDSKDIYIADVIFDSWSGKDQWEEYFKTNTSVQEFRKRINETAESVLITRRSQVQILPPPPYFSSVKSVFNLAYYFSGSRPDFDLPNHIPNHLVGFLVPDRPHF